MLTFFSEQCIRVLFTDPQISFFINFFIKNGSHCTIYTFKNYFATVISAINFQFQQNKSYLCPIHLKISKCAFGCAFVDPCSCFQLFIYFLFFSAHKNYFITMFSIFSFNKNKLYPNGP